MIRVENLGKQYRIGAQQASYKTLRESLAGAVRAPLRRFRSNGNRDQGDHIWALKDVSFEIKTVRRRIIGRNGAGNQRFLSALTNYEPLTGISIFMVGVASLLEVGTGFTLNCPAVKTSI